MRRKSKHRKPTSYSKWPLVLVIVAVLMVVIIVMVSRLPSSENAEIPTTTTESGQPGETIGQISSTQQEQLQPIELGNDLVIANAANYAGIYMEDGSGEIVSNVMMIIVTNEGEKDLQLARITLNYELETRSFEVTDLAAGASTVLLEKNRQSMPEEDSFLPSVENVVFFDSPMDMCEDIIEIAGLDGMLNVKNISDTDISGDIYVYYKYSADDLYYGGVTFRARIEGGLAAGEIRQIAAGHYTAKGCKLLRVSYAR